jgi:hypothetical protein
MKTDWLHQQNFAKSTLAAQLLIAGTTLTMAAGEGLLFPDGSGDHFQMVIWTAGYGSPIDDVTREIVHATATVTPDVYTVARAQEGTTAKQWEIADLCALVLTAAKIAEIEARIDLESKDWSVVTADPANAISGGRYAANTTAGAFTITLPAAPEAGNDRVTITDYAGKFDTLNLTVARNSLNIMGLAENLILDVRNATVVLEYVDVTQGWRIL